MRSFVQIVSTPTSDTLGTTLVLHFDSKRYLVGNLHEGLQRTAIERGTKLIKVADIFLTGRVEWKNTGGMIGMILTLADATSVAAAAVREIQVKKLEKKTLKQLEDGQDKGGLPSVPQLTKPTLRVHGGPNITHTLATARRFVFRKGMPVEVNEFRERTSDHQWNPSWSDENIRVWALPIRPLDGRSDVSSGKPRKRSLDDYQEDLISATKTDTEGLNELNLVDQDIQDDQIRRAVVGDMFDSQWRLDALVEMPIASVKMPAALFVRDPHTKKLAVYTGPMPGGIEPLPDITVLVRKPWPAALVENLPPTKPSPTAMSYIIRNYPQRGKFDPAKAMALGVKPGPHFHQLTIGKSVLSKDGKIVLPEQVMGQAKPGAGFAVVELPSRDYVEPLVQRPEWRNPEVMEAVNSIVWNLGPGVTSDPTLKSFMVQFSHLKHIVSSPDHCSDSLSMDSAAAAAIRLNQIDPERFVIPIHNNRETPVPTDALYTADTHPGCIIAKRGMTINLEPNPSVEESTSVPPLNTASVIEETPKNILLLAKAIRQEIASESVKKQLSRQNLPSPEAEIVCLGTGSALPSKYRNVSATLLRVPGSGSYLLDCGENTLGQLRRVYSPEEMAEVLRDLRMIWISHLHADHHLGTTSVIKAWYEAVYGGSPTRIDALDCMIDEPTPSSLVEVFNGPRRLCVVSEPTFLKWLKEYSSAEDFGYRKIVPLSVWGASGNPDTSTAINCNSVRVGYSTEYGALSSALKAVTGLTNLAAANVAHCHGAKAVSLTFPTGFKFSYSGDCRPSKTFTSIGRNSTVLLHEATFDDELGGDAVAKKHCTTSEAIGVGVAMGARRVLLTHFSQRYQKIPMMDAVEGQELPLSFEDADAAEEDTGMILEGVKKPEAPSLSELAENDASLEEILGAPTTRSPVSKSTSAASTTTQKVDLGSIHNRDMKVGVCFDYMRVKVKDIALLEKFTPVLLKLYEDEADRKSLKSIDSDEVKETQQGKNEKQRKQKQKEKKEKVGKQTQEERTGEEQGKGKGSNAVEKKKQKIGGGRMGRQEVSEEQRKEMRSGATLFS